jgi:hypothetical protein
LRLDQCVVLGFECFERGAAIVSDHSIAGSNQLTIFMFDIAAANQTREGRT